MIAPGDRVLVAVSGGKDSLGLWQLLRELGYDADGLYVGLGIGEYSDESGEYARAFAERARLAAARGRPARRRTGSTCPTASKAIRRVAVLGVRAVEAPRVQRRRARERLRRARDRPQPRRRGRGAPRQRVALGRRLSRPPAPGAARGARVRAQGEAARATGRARARGVLRARPASTTSSRSARWRRATGTSATRSCSTRSRSARRARRPRSCSASSSAGTSASPATRWRSARTCSRARSAARRRRPTSARSAGCAPGATRQHPVRVGDVTASGLFAAGDQVLLVDNKRRRHLVTLEVGGQFHTHAGIVAHDDLIGHPDGTHRAHVARRAPRRGAADARRVRARDAARRAGDLPEGPRADPRARRHLPRRAHPRVGRRLGRAHDRAAARDRADRSRDRLRDPRRLRAARGAATCTGSSATDVPLDVEVRDVYEGIDERDLDRIMLDLPEPWRVVKHALEALAAGRHPARVPADDPAGRPAARGARQRAVRHGRDARGAAAHLARRGTVDPARPPHGRAHGLPHRTAACWRGIREPPRAPRERARPRRPGAHPRRRGRRLAARLRRARLRVGRRRASALAIGVRFVPQVVTAFGGDQPREPGVGRRAVPRARRRSLGQTLGLVVGGARAPGAPDAPSRSRGGTGSRARRSARSACSCCSGW